MSSIRSETIMQCPYDANHKVVASRFENHLVKCQRISQFQVCPFNAKHHVKRSELRTHISSCPDRFRIAHEKVLCDNKIEEPFSSQSSQYGDGFSTEENWDEEAKKVPIMPPLYAYKGSHNDAYLALRPSDRKAVRNKMIEDFKRKLNAVDEKGIPIYIPEEKK